MPKYKIVPPPGVLYVEQDGDSGIIGVNMADTGKVKLRIVRCGPPEVNQHGTAMPMKYREGQLVLAFPKTALPMPRGFMVHQDSVACVLEETDGADEMQPPQVTGSKKDVLRMFENREPIKA